LAAGYERSQTEIWIERFARSQDAIRAVDEAIEDEQEFSEPDPFSEDEPE
jgi:hypothetical protein